MKLSKNEQNAKQNLEISKAVLHIEETLFNEHH